MNASDLLTARIDYAKEIAQKAEALRLEAQIEVHRYEGAVGALKQAVAILCPNANKQAGVAEALKEIEKLLESGQAELIASRGRVQQGEKTLDMLESLFQADTAAAQRLLKNAEVSPKSKGRHPGPSMKNRRNAAAASNLDQSAAQVVAGSP